MLRTNNLLSLIINSKNNLKCQKRCLGFFGRATKQTFLFFLCTKTLKLRQLVKQFSFNSNEFSLFHKLLHEVKSGQKYVIQTSRLLFCSRDCCLCAKHQSVKELRHARSKGKQQTQRKPNKSNQKPQANTPQKTKNHSQASSLCSW